MAAIGGRLKVTERHHRGSAFSFSSGCRFERPVYPGSTRSARSRSELARPRLDSNSNLADARASAPTDDGHRYPSGGAMCRLATIEAPANPGPWHCFLLDSPPNTDFKFGRAIAIRYRYASGVVNEGGAYATRFDRFSAQVPPSRPKSPQALRRSRCHRGGSIGHTPPINRPRLVKALQIARTLP